MGVVLAAVTGFVPSWHLSTWTAAATTVAAAVGAHLAATQHQRIAAAYASTTEQLERLVALFDPATAMPAEQAQFVAEVERVLEVQNEGWTDLFESQAGAGGGPVASELSVPCSRLAREWDGNGWGIDKDG